MPNSSDIPQAALDTTKLEDFLKSHWAGFTTLEQVSQFKSGYSNLTYSLTTNLGKVVLRRPPLGPRAGAAHDMIREYGLLKGLQQVFAKAPNPILLCDDEAIIGAPFYLMELVEGQIIRMDTQGKTQDLSANQRREASTSLIKTLAQLHQIPVIDTVFESIGKPSGYIQRQVDGWTDRFAKAKTENVPEINQLVEYLRAELPEDSTGSIIHNDYKFDNVVFAPGDFTRVSAVLDWEMCTVGNPLMDLGLSLAYWAHPEEVVDMPFLGVNATHLPGCLRRNELVAAYEMAIGSEVGDVLYYYVFGNFKIAGIIQQIYARYAAGHAKDSRFAQLHHVVGYLIRRGELAIANGKIE